MFCLICLFCFVSFACVCFFTGWGSHVTITNDALDLTIEGSLDMSKLVQVGPHCTGTPPPPTDPVQGREHEACTVGKRAVGILPECCLVFTVVFEQL